MEWGGESGSKDPQHNTLLARYVRLLIPNRDQTATVNTGVLGVNKMTSLLSRSSHYCRASPAHEDYKADIDQVSGSHTPGMQRANEMQTITMLGETCSRCF